MCMDGGGNGQNGHFNVDASGSFSKYINTCNATEITLKAVDVNNLKSGDPADFTLATNTDVGTMEACTNAVVDGVFIQFGANTYAITGTTLTNPPIGGAGTAYQFTVVDDQGSGNKILYSFTIVDWGSSVFGYAYEKTIIGTPATEFDFGGGDIALTELGTQPGELVIFDITNVNVKLNGNDNPDGSIQIIGTIQ